MKKATVAILVLLLMGFVCAPPVSFAGNGQGGNNGAGGSGGGNGPGDGSGPIHDIYSGEYFSYTGTIIELFGKGGGFGLAVGVDESTESILIYGLGPVWFWESLGLVRPTVGDEITVEGYSVPFGDDQYRNIATVITVYDNGTEAFTVTLRDEETGLPLWLDAQRRIKNRVKTGSWE